MNMKLVSVALLSASVVALIALPSAAQSPGGSNGARPMFTYLPPNAPGHKPPLHPASQLTQWNGSFTDLTGHHITYTMAGTDPSTNNAPTTIPVVVVPIKMVYGSRNGNMTFDPNTHTVSNGNTVTANTLASPLFKTGVDFVAGSVDLGNTQYIDAYQRGNFWSSVHTNTNYHVLLGSPTVLAEQTITVSRSAGKVITNPFGRTKVGTMGINQFDSQLQGIMTRNASTITPGVLPIFLTYNIFLTQNGGCCIGGYHSANGAQPSGQTYSYASYVDEAGSFSQDVSALSHEIGEWMDDPFTNNAVNCTDNSIMENGDPLENRANYGDYAYTLNGFTYNLQDLVFIGYFGAPRSTSVNSWLDLHNVQTTVCPGQ
ncbi:MAG TPA: hypothetical protein VLC74_01325 [Rhizomicrobium sp.]|nr:hypothetical protein [Rhizomicrobium sp.]